MLSCIFTYDGFILLVSLKSLPTEKGEIPTEQNFSLDLDLINIAAKWLREYLNLTVFGFDVVVSVFFSLRLRSFVSEISISFMNCHISKLVKCLLVIDEINFLKK